MTVAMGTKRRREQQEGKPMGKKTRPRKAFDASDLLRQAIALRASKESVARRRTVSHSELLEELLESLLAEELRELRESRGKE